MVQKLGFAEDFDKGVRCGLENMGAVVDPLRHPALHQHISELAENAGLKSVPHVVIAREFPMGPAWFRKLPNAGAMPIAHAVSVSESMLDLTKSSVNGRMSPMLEAVMAHEFSHLKDGSFAIVAGRLLPFAMPIVAMSALSLYDRAKARTQRVDGESKGDYCNRLADNIDTISNEDIARCHQQAGKHDGWHVDPNWNEGMTRAGRYAIAAAIGLGVGLLGARFHSRASEFRADRMAVELTNNPEEFKRFFTVLEAEWTRVLKNTPRDTALDKQVENSLHRLMAETLHAHPSTAERIAHIDKVAAKRAAKMGAPATSHLI